ncbi:hypothetical protein SADUNF_Sadunf04G0096500 [Salix dunnii]|uniref:Uncharacterized protein n=1 Tax=Salix dunnii TaxID=1413687 RepID=A0A835MZ56_9ROSI|nr:hypothetical protein SADUNF_Sadunf04G0096500 [Salix dunnii]
MKAKIPTCPLGEDMFLANLLVNREFCFVALAIPRDVELYECSCLLINACKISLCSLSFAALSQNKLINIVVPGIIDERAANTKGILNPWERNKNHTLCLNSTKAIGCTVPHLLLSLNSQIINSSLRVLDVEELMELVPEMDEFSSEESRLRETFSFDEEEITSILNELYADLSNEIEFEDFLKEATYPFYCMELGVICDLKGQATAKSGASQQSSSFLKATTMTLFTISESQKASYVDQIYSYLGDHPFLNKLINIVVPGIIDERAVNIRTHGIGCTVVNIRTQECASNLEKFEA